MNSKRPWMSIQLTGTLLWIWAIFNPGKTDCWEYLAQHLRSNRPVETFIQQKKYRKSFKNSSCWFNSNWASRVEYRDTSDHLMACFRREHKSMEGKLITFDCKTLEIKEHVLVKRPQCGECGDPKYQLDSQHSGVFHSHKIRLNWTYKQLEMWQFTPMIACTIATTNIKPARNGMQIATVSSKP